MLVFCDSCVVTYLLACVLLHTRGLCLGLVHCCWPFGSFLVWATRLPQRLAVLPPLLPNFLTGSCPLRRAVLDKGCLHGALKVPRLSSLASVPEAKLRVMRKPTGTFAPCNCLPTKAGGAPHRERALLSTSCSARIFKNMRLSLCTAAPAVTHSDCCSSGVLHLATHSAAVADKLS